MVSIWGAERGGGGAYMIPVWFQTSNLIELNLQQQFQNKTLYRGCTSLRSKRLSNTGRAVLGNAARVSLFLHRAP